MRTVLAGDLGGTKCRFALIDADYGVHGVQRFDTVRELEPFLDEMVGAVGRLLDERERSKLADGLSLEAPTAIGLGTAGIVPPAGEAVGYAPNLPISDFPISSFLRDRFGLPVTLINDGRASAWGEYLRGHAKQRDPLVCLFFGTGIGIGVMVDGKPYAGGNNAAGEIGHTVYRPGGRRCVCGRLGHFESYCGGRAITERAAEMIGDTIDGERWTVGKVVECAKLGGSGSDAANTILDDAFAALSALVTNCCTVLNPSAVVMGGGVLSGWPELRQRIIDHVTENTDPPFHEKLTFVDSMGGSDAILWGAAAATGALWTP